jgi:YjbE family integral membrane protein
MSAIRPQGLSCFYRLGAKEYCMDMFSMDFVYALGAIVLIDLVLAGDNALVIAMAARKLPPIDQKKAILWGTVGAIVVRSAMTLAVVWLLKIPGLLLIGGALLVWISIKLLAPEDHAPGDDSNHAASNFIGAMKTIVIADAVMGIDNVLGVAGAAQGNFLLVVLGLLISIPIVVWCSGLVLKLVDRFPMVIYLGSAVLAWTAARMMLAEPVVHPYVAPLLGWSWLLIAGVVCGVLLIGYYRNRRHQAFMQARNSKSIA